MGYRAYSNTLFGVKVTREAVKNASIKAQYDNQLSYFYSDYENSNYVVIGFRLGQTEYNTYSEPVACIAPNSSMAQEVLDFCKENKIKCSHDDVKIYTMTFHSY